ncbi:2-phospho-L-lactate guanylyltransferase [Nocardioides kribbensis]|uniref:2-phospho-L-lactate guanylyltransferase n=1 Tax=Nocardioides kribbensis TaxID=305517 RepID=A0ABV1NZX4_9ACTN
MSVPPAVHAVLLPVKPPAVGKSRLLGVSDEGRRELAEAFALDTARACVAAARVARVLVATDDVGLSHALARLGCEAIPDGTTSDLNATLRLTAAEARRRWPDLEPVALCADLPALRPGDLDAALGALVPGGASFVADADGVGTTLYTAPHADFAPSYGEGSREAHLAAGALEVRGDLVTLRRDVDDLDDLAVALGLGVGPATSVAAHRWGLAAG